MSIENTLSEALNDLDRYLADEDRRGAEPLSREDALYVLMAAVRWDRVFTTFSEADAARVAAADIGPVLAYWQRWEQEADADTPAPIEIREEYIARLTATARALHILDTQVVPLLRTALRPLAPLVLRATTRRLEDYLEL
ncbi:MAG: hypothetical protein HGA45_21565 [Chloroflexales bacterium]|nr:hypothetical protein [Chloroflexales bacterium]